MTGNAETPLLANQAHAHELNDHDRHDAEVFMGEYDHGIRPLWHPERLLWQVRAGQRRASAQCCGAVPLAMRVWRLCCCVV